MIISTLSEIRMFRNKLVTVAKTKKTVSDDKLKHYVHNISDLLYWEGPHELVICQVLQKWSRMALQVDVSQVYCRLSNYFQHVCTVHRF
jgi:hypothetical protein